jgi:hypothetical protein
MTEMIGAGVLAPAAIAFGVYWLASRLLPDSAASRYPVVIGLLAGFVAGCVLLLESDALKPSRHWHWLPWLGLMAGFTGCVSVRTASPIRWLLVLTTSAAVAWFLVPTWANLSPPRVVWLIALSVGLCVLIALSDPLPRRFGGRLVLGLLGITAAAVAVMIAACVSVTYAQVAGVAACALGGVWGGVCLRQRDDELAVRAALPAALTIVGGIAFVACIESERPQYGLLLLPIAPLGLWICQLPALHRLSGHKATVLRIAWVVIPLLAAAAVSYARVL